MFRLGNSNEIINQLEDIQTLFDRLFQEYNKGVLLEDIELTFSEQELVKMFGEYDKANESIFDELDNEMADACTDAILRSYKKQ